MSARAELERELVRLTAQIAAAKPRARPPASRPSVGVEFATRDALDRALAERDAGALFVLSDSGGKDSQAMRLLVRSLVPRAQIVVVHAALGHVEWPGALEHAAQGAAREGYPFVVARARRGLLDMVRDRFAHRPDAPSWPSPALRQCTSDLKRGPIEREVRRYMKAHGFSRVVMAVGLRAQESAARSKAVAWRREAAQSVAGRTWHTWLPIHGLDLAGVWALIHGAGERAHPAYYAGNERLSCQFCIMGSPNDLRNAALHDPELYAEYLELERATGYAMHPSRRPLEQVTGVTLAQARAGRRHLPLAPEGPAGGGRGCR